MQSSQRSPKHGRRGARDGHATRERILSAAEHLFAEHGFDGVSLRSIAAAADSQLALLHYHFGSKLDLYRAVWVRRFEHPPLAGTASEWSSIDFERPGAVVVRELVERYIATPLKLTKALGSTDFLVILSRESFDPKAKERGLVKEFLDPFTARIDDAFAKALPQLSRREIQIRGSLMAATVQVSLPGGESLLRSTKRARQSPSLLSGTIDFIVGGWLQPPHAA